MGLIEDIAKWLGKAVAEEMQKPFKDITKRLDDLETKTDALIQWKNKEEVEGLECDLAMLDDRICQMIQHADSKGYTTAEERRRCNRMHEAYRARGGNHGEENEYARFCKLPTEEEWRRNR